MRSGNGLIRTLSRREKRLIVFTGFIHSKAEGVAHEDVTFLRAPPVSARPKRQAALRLFRGQDVSRSATEEESEASRKSTAR